MKRKLFAAFWLLCLLMLIPNAIKAQEDNWLLNKEISITRTKISVRYLLDKIFTEHEIPIAYLDNYVPLRKSLKIEADKVYKASELLEMVCHNEDLGYEVVGNQVLLRYYQRPDDEYQFNIYGRIKDAKTGQVLIGATVYLDKAKTGIATNGYGVYALTVTRGVHEISISYIGYEILKVNVDVYKNKQFDFRLNEMTYELENVVVDGHDYFDMETANVLSSANRIDMEMTKNIPYLGEVDVFQSSVLLPGITNIAEGTSGINVRGGSNDQNLFMLDEAVVYNANHFFGLVSVFNPDAVQDVEILKGNFPAKYGGRNSSVMHVRQKEGNEHEFKASGGLGLISSRLMLEGPMFNHSASYLLSGRSTFWDLITNNQNNPVLTDSRSRFQDLNSKVKFNINKNNKMYLSSYIGIDSNNFGDETSQRWGNQVHSIRWNNIVKDKHFLNTTAYFSRYRYQVINNNDLADFVGESDITDGALKFDMTSFVSTKQIVDYGAMVTVHAMNPGRRIPGTGSTQNEFELPREYGVESAAYISSENNWFENFTTSFGIRLSNFVNTGHSDQFIYSGNEPKSIESIIDTLHARTSDARSVYFNLLPRITVKYNISEHSAFKLGYFQTVQYLHLLTNDLTPSSEDIWKISDSNILPTEGHQLTFGWYKHFVKSDFNASAEFFYKKRNRTVEFKDAADFSFNQNIETELLEGKERVFGVELFLKKTFGKLTGWVGYTLSRAETRIESTFPEEIVNDGDYFPSSFDRTHDVGISAIYSLGKRVSISSNFVYYTGRPYSFPSERYEVDGLLIPNYTDRNQQRLASYNRLDFSATIHTKNVRKSGRPKRYESNWVISVYNVYNRKNAQSYFFTHSDADPTVPEVRRLSVLGTIVPSLTYNFRF